MNTTQISLKISQNAEDRIAEAKANLENLLSELTWSLPSNTRVYVAREPSINDIQIFTQRPIGGGGGGIQLTEILVSLLQQVGFAVAVITAVYTVITKLMEREKDCEITIESGEKKISIKGHRIPKPEELIKSLFPELDEDNQQEVKSRLKELENGLRRSDPQAKVSLKVPHSKDK
jgi:hypothetical protein